MLRIRDVYPVSDIFPSRIPGSASKNLNILTQKLFLSSRKYDPVCSSRIYIDPDLLPIPDPGSRGQKGTGSATLAPVVSRTNHLHFRSKKFFPWIHVWTCIITGLIQWFHVKIPEAWDRLMHRDPAHWASSLSPGSFRSPRRRASSPLNTKPNTNSLL